MTDPTPSRRARHLMDPAHPVRPVNDHRLTRVQRWVVSVLAATTIMHLSVGLVVGALFVDRAETVARVGLCVIGGLFGAVAVAVARVIHRQAVASPWLAVGFAPGLVGLGLVLTR